LDLSFDRLLMMMMISCQYLGLYNVCYSMVIYDEFETVCKRTVLG